MFFSFDGVDGAGKSTQIGLLADALLQQGREVVTCRDPGGTAQLLDRRQERSLAHEVEDAVPADVLDRRGVGHGGAARRGVHDGLTEGRKVA